MAIDLTRERGIPIDDQLAFDWTDLCPLPTSKLNDDAFTRVRVIFAHGIEAEANGFQHAMARMNRAYQRELAVIRRVEHQQQTLVNWLLPVDLSPIETTIAYEQVAIEVTAHFCEHEPDPYHAQIQRFGLLEDFDHLYRFTALADRLFGLDANNILQSYTDIRPGRPTAVEHRFPLDDLRNSYDRRTASPLTKVQGLALMAAEQQTRNYYMNFGPTFADPLARQLYAEIASIEEQHVTQYESLLDPDEGWLEKWLLHEVVEVWTYAGCAAWENNPRIKAIWQRLADMELGHLSFVADLFRRVEKRDPFEVIPPTLPEPIAYQAHREFVRNVLQSEVHLRAVATQIVDPRQTPETPETLRYRERLNVRGSPSEIVAANYTWKPGTELVGAQVGRAK